MSHEVVPSSTPVPPETEHQTPPTHPTIVQIEEGGDAGNDAGDNVRFSDDFLCELLLKARAEGAAFAYYRANPPDSLKKAVLAVEGVRTSSVIRFLMDDYRIPEDPPLRTEDINK